MAAVKTVSLTKEYSNGEHYLRAVDDISFTVEENEFVAIMGSSGCGKTTLLNLLGGLENPTHGCVYINDVDITQLSMEERSSFRRWHIGFIFQNFNLIPEMNVFENIVLPAKLMERNISKKEVMRIAEELEIEEKLLQNPMTLSGGQQQRVAIARAIYTHPTILLGDELTGNLDSTTSISVMKFLKKMCKKYSQTMIIVTHDERIAAMADRILAVNKEQLFFLLGDLLESSAIENAWKRLAQVQTAIKKEKEESGSHFFLQNQEWNAETLEEFKNTTVTGMFNKKIGGTYVSRLLL